MSSTGKEQPGKRVDERELRTLAAGSGASPPALLAAQQVIAGRYRIGRFIARGGMGEVYEAHDLELSTAVALKTISAALVADAKALKRFKREVLLARTVSHPNVCRSYDLGTDPGLRLTFLTMELLHGETVHQVLRSEGRFERQRVISILRQVAGALTAAHTAGVLHRDLKSSNLFLEPGPPERAVVADFGLALAFDRPSDVGATALSTMGTVVGTHAYMSPEQVSGSKLGPPSDIYSLGIVAYEMLTANLPFEGGSALSVAAKRLIMDPRPLREQVPDLDPALESVVMRCLERQPGGRFQTAAELDAALAAAATDLSSERTLLATPSGRMIERRQGLSRRRTLRRGALALTSLAALALAALALLQRGGGDPPIPEATPRQLTSVAGWAAHPALSPDGGFIAYSALEGANEDIWIVDRNGQGELRLTYDPAADRSPTWLPDGSAVIFASNRGGGWGIWKVPRLGGKPILLVADAEDPAVSPDGERIAFARSQPPLGEARIAVAALANAAEVTLVTADGDGLWSHHNPAWSPDGRLLAYQDERDVWLVDPDGGKPRRLTTAPEPDLEPVFSPDGASIYFASHREGTLAIWRTPLEADRAIRLTLGTGPEREPNVSADGRALVYATFVDDYDLVVVERASGRQHRLRSRRTEAEPALSPDGSRLVFSSDRRGPAFDLWGVTLDAVDPQGSPERLTELNGSVACPSFSPDGRWLAFHRVVEGRRDIWVMPATGGLPHQVTAAASIDIQPAWSPSGGRLAYVSELDGVARIQLLRVADGRAVGEPRLLHEAITEAMAPAWSPDESAIAYVKLDDETNDVWIVPADGAAPPRRLTAGARASAVAWDGERLLVAGRWDGARRELRWVDPVSGSDQPVELPIDLGADLQIEHFALSADGAKLVLVVRESRGDVWVLEALSHRY